MLTATDFYNWKQDPMTKAFFEACEKRVQDAVYNLVSSAGMDSNNDNYTRGFIAAYNEITQVKFDEVVEEV